jgi:hypothetical protein
VRTGGASVAAVVDDIDAVGEEAGALGIDKPPGALGRLAHGEEAPVGVTKVDRSLTCKREHERSTIESMHLHQPEREREREIEKRV